MCGLALFAYFPSVRQFVNWYFSIKFADVVIGLVMRYVQGALLTDEEPTVPQQHAFANLGTNEELRLNINFICLIGN